METMNGTAVAQSVDLDALSAMAVQSARMEFMNAGVKDAGYSYINIVGNGSRDGRLKPGHEDFMPEAKPGMFCLKAEGKNILLGNEFEATVRGAFHVFSEKSAAEGSDGFPRQVDVWHPDDATKFPVETGGYFKRPLPNGNFLMPMNYLFLEVKGYEGLLDTVFTCQGGANKQYAELMKLISKNAVSANELKLKVSTRLNGEFYYPHFEIVGRNYEIADGKVKLVEGGRAAEELAKLIKLSFDLNKDYIENRIARRRDVTAYFMNAPAQQAQFEVQQPVAQAALPAQQAENLKF